MIKVTARFKTSVKQLFFYTLYLAVEKKRKREIKTVFFHQLAAFLKQDSWGNMGAYDIFHKEKKCPSREYKILARYPFIFCFVYSFKFYG